ncbi:hypothetical protein J3R83DRAFT_4090 [Lanmaoa asiatica]|nr:hypothetical protein J3R83DRAFT_4089 [Lanmaoa asiatica]KAH0827424.1 hypothetical protein J3R83DRAFT_4090 [Lanmaoa asiatica]
MRGWSVAEAGEGWAMGGDNEDGQGTMGIDNKIALGIECVPATLRVYQDVLNEGSVGGGGGRREGSTMGANDDKRGTMSVEDKEHWT